MLWVRYLREQWGYTTHRSSQLNFLSHHTLFFTRAFKVSVHVWGFYCCAAVIWNSSWTSLWKKKLSTESHVTGKTTLKTTTDYVLSIYINSLKYITALRIMQNMLRLPSCPLRFFSFRHRLWTKNTTRVEIRGTTNYKTTGRVSLGMRVTCFRNCRPK